MLGTFALTKGTCAAGVTGSYFRMLTPGGVLNGPAAGYISNANSTCSRPTYTLLAPGTDGGLVSGAYQPEPAPAFDKAGNALANRIVQPATFFGVHFSVATTATDPQTGAPVPAPSVLANGTQLSGDLRAFGASWNGGHFNQGSPKPNGSSPGLTAGPIGTYDPATNAFTIEWTSLIVGGPFDGFTGQWHLSGEFVAASVPPAATTGSTGTTAASTSVGSGELANTGAGIPVLLATAVLLVVFGSALQIASRRRPDST